MGQRQIPRHIDVQSTCLYLDSVFRNPPGTCLNPFNYFNRLKWLLEIFTSHFFDCIKMFFIFCCAYEGFVLIRDLTASRSLPLEKINSGHVRHQNVRDNNICTWKLLRTKADRFFESRARVSRWIREGHNMMSMFCQNCFEQQGYCRIIFYDNYSKFLCVSHAPSLSLIHQATDILANTVE